MRFSLTIFLLSFLFVLYSQDKYDANWCFGIGAGINFNNLDTPQTFPTNTNNYEASASISDSSGSLLFYLTVNRFTGSLWDANNNLITNGDSINVVFTCTNGSLILPAVAQLDYFYLFHIGLYQTSCANYFECYRLYYSTIRKHVNGDLEVIDKNKLLLNEGIEEKLAAVKHANGNDWWLLVHQFGNGTSTNRFYKFLIEADTIIGPTFQDEGTPYQSFVGEMAFSKKGNRLALAWGAGVDAFSFNRTNGLLDNFEVVQNASSIQTYGCEFSPSGDVLYVTDVTSSGDLYQYNLNAQDIEASRVQLTQNNFPNLTFGQLQLAPNNKIYLAHPNLTGLQPPFDSLSQNLGVINNPDSVGTTCDFVLSGLFLGSSARSLLDLPNVPNYNLGALNTTAIGRTEINLSNVYPNPASDFLMVEVFNSQRTFKLYDILGKEALTTQLTTGKNQVETKNLTNGIYIYRVTGETKVGKVFIEK